MKQSDAYDRLIREYLSKLSDSGCDGCVAEHYCMKNDLRNGRYPQPDCPEKLKAFLRQTPRVYEV